MNLDPPGTLLRCGLACLLGGVGWSLVAALIVFVGSVRIPPRVAPSRIWPEWHRHRMVWAVALVVGAVGAVLTAEWLFKQIGLRDLYWLGRWRELLLISRLGGASGYLLGLLLLVVAAIRAQRRPS
jgi:hypothetical protein